VPDWRRRGPSSAVPDGSRSPDDLAYVALCVAQAKAHLNGYAARNRAATATSHEPERDAMRALQRELGLSARAADPVDSGEDDG